MLVLFLFFLSCLCITYTLNNLELEKIEEVGKTTRPFRYDLTQIPYEYTVGVRNRFKGLDLIDRMPDELWNEVCDTVQETGIKTIPGGSGTPYLRLLYCLENKWCPGNGSTQQKQHRCS